MNTVYASIGNTDDKLTQNEWSAYCQRFRNAVKAKADRILGGWFSVPDSPYQNACIAFEIAEDDATQMLIRELCSLAGEYRQDSIAWAWAHTQFLSHNLADGGYTEERPRTEYQ